MSGDVFSRSVVLIADHNTEGAFGLILNKKNRNMTARLCEVFGFEVEVYDGGPVEHSKVFFIIKGSKVTAHLMELSKEFYLTEDIEQVVAAIIEDRLSLNEVKVFSGYSGWAAGQLETEVDAKMWTVVDIYDLDYTLPNDQNLWKKIMQNLGGEYLLWANAPEDVSLN